MEVHSELSKWIRGIGLLRPAQQKVVIIPSAIHLCLANDMVFFSLRWYFLLILPRFCFGPVKFFV